MHPLSRRQAVASSAGSRSCRSPAPAWRSTRAQRRGLDLYLPIAEFTAFLAEDRREVRQLLTEAALVK
jgi:hypothetical protein